MTISVQRTKVNPPKGFQQIDPTDPDSRWSRDDLSVGCDYAAEWDAEGGVKLYAYGQEVGSDDVAAAINDLIRFWSSVRAAHAEHARGSTH